MCRRPRPAAPNCKPSGRVTDRFDSFVGGGVTYQCSTNSLLDELPLLRIKAYALVDPRAGVETKDGRWRISVWGWNVGNPYYWSAATHANDTTVRFAGKLATYGVAVTYRFD